MVNSLKTQRRLASDILRVGENRVWIDPSKWKEVKEAITRSDVESLIDKNIIKGKELVGQSRGRTRYLKKNRLNHGKGKGSRKGKKHARMKFEWKDRVRALRNELFKMRSSGKIDNKQFRVLYSKITGNAFHSVNHMRNYITENVSKENK